MPDIILLSKIVYQKLSFQEVAKSLSVSLEALSIRLIDLLAYLLDEPKERLQSIIFHYRSGNNSTIINLFSKCHDVIVQDYRNYEPTLIDRVNFFLEMKYFITDDDIPELSQLAVRSNMTSKKIGTWAYYNKGKTIFYAWDKNRLTREEALQKAKDNYYLR